MAGRGGLSDDETPRGRLLSGGAESLSDAELLSVLLRTNNGEAGEILDEIGGFHQLTDIDRHTLLRCSSKARTTTVLAAVEFGRRLARAEIPKRVLLCRLGTVVGYLRTRYERGDQEVMGALYLDTRYRLLHEAELFRGTLSRAAVEPRAILREGLACKHSPRADILGYGIPPSGLRREAFRREGDGDSAWWACSAQGALMAAPPGGPPWRHLPL